MSDDAVLTSELDDGDETHAFDWSNIRLSRLREPEALRHLAGLALALLVLWWPDRTAIIVGRLVGVTLIVYGTLSAWRALRTRPFSFLPMVAAIAAVLVGAFLVVEPARTETAVGRLLGVVLAARGAWALAAVRRGERHEFAWRLATAVSLLSVGVFVAVFPTTLLGTVIVTVACVWIAVELIALSVILGPKRPDDEPIPDTSALLAQWFADRPKAMDDRRRLYDELLYDGDRAQTKIVRFVMLMVFASVIASMGVVSDSTAVVVGAMLIAPLMTPLMGMALALVMGWPNRLRRSALVAGGGVILAIGTGFAIGRAQFVVVDTLTNSQIVSRSSPTVVDLVIAVAAGAAGAYALSRPDVSNSLPGVAIAIALVPPLTVIGISYSQQDWASGHGALLLFLTNALAILVVGGVMFLLLGVAPLSRLTGRQHRVRTAAAVVAGSAVLITGALVLNGTTVATNVFEQRSTQETVAEWIEPFPDHSTIDIRLDGDSVSVVLAGPDAVVSPTADELADRLSQRLGREIVVDLRIRLETQETSG